VGCNWRGEARQGEEDQRMMHAKAARSACPIDTDDEKGKVRFKNRKLPERKHGVVSATEPSKDTRSRRRRRRR
jgi:hypothetical protein